MADEHAFIGRVARTYARLDYRHALLSPLIVSTEDRTKWHGPIANPVTSFPDRGFVFWHDSPSNLKEGTYWVFDAYNHPLYEPPQKCEKFQASTPRRLVELLDLRTSFDEQTLRRGLTESGIALPSSPIGGEVYFRIADGNWAGPFQLETQKGGLWKLSGADPGAIGIWKINESQTSQVNLGTQHVVLNPTVERGIRVGAANWEPDLLIAERVLRRLRKLNPDALKGIAITEAIFEKYLAAIAEADLIEQQVQRELASGERIRAIWSSIEKNRQLLEEAAKVMAESPAIQQQFEDYRQKTFAEILAKESKKVEDALAGKRATLADIEKTLSSRSTDLKDVTSRLEQEDRRLAESVAKFESRLVERLKKMLVEKEDLFAELALLRSALLPSTLKHSGNEGHVKSPPNRSTEHRTNASTKITASEDMFARLNSKLASVGLSHSVAKELHASFLAGVMPVVVGSRAADALRIYADCITGGRIAWVSVSSRIVDTRDLLVDGAGTHSGDRVAGSHALKMLQEAADSHALNLIVLEGFNRALADSYLIPLLASRWETLRGESSRSITIDGERSIIWPANVLIAAIPSTGHSTLPVSGDIWTYAALVDVDGQTAKPPSIGSPKSKQVKRQLDELGPSHVEMKDWESWTNEVIGEGGEPAYSLAEKVHKSIPLGPDFRPIIVPLHAAAQWCGVVGADVERWILQCNVLPRFASNQQDLSGLAKKLGIPQTDRLNRISALSLMLQGR